MDWREWSARRWPIGGVVAVLLIAAWYLISYAPERQVRDGLESREATLRSELAALDQAIAEAKRPAAGAQAKPVRFASPSATALAPVDRLKFFLENITTPANDLDLSYFTVTPLAPVAAPSYEEIPFSIAVTGNYASLADFLYQLEYQRDFVVRELNLSQNAGGVRADFQLAALLPRGATTPPAKEPADPGRPTSLELARDPFLRAPAVLVTGADGRKVFLNVPPGLSLSGILNGGKRIAAIINHEPYSVGDVVENKRITRITRDGVEMTDDARTYFLEMPRPNLSLPRVPSSKEASRR
ncbi:MAG: type 4a pilus biogenesis protein PilO [Candidatus Binatia bacterium]